jgi:tRNA-Thr(GGU) m(6)t(6)A37 methyltransferase TsaA
MKAENIGVVRNELKTKSFVKQPEKLVSQIVIHDTFVEGLYKIEAQKYIDIVFWFHESAGYELVTKIFTGETRGVFASRSPNRPNGLGVTTVKLIRREGNTLFVSGLDAIDGTPVVDIKPSDFSFMTGLDIVDDTPMENPRFDISKYISRGQIDKLLKLAGQLHGHYCPGLAMGVMATSYAMDKLRRESDGMEDLLAVVETNNCFSDGVQFVSGCTFGNNALVFKDFGKNALSLGTREGVGFRVIARNDIRDQINQYFPAFHDLFEKVVVQQNHEEEIVVLYKQAAREASFGILDLPFDSMFECKETRFEVPKYAPIEKSLECDLCHEVYMASRGQIQNNQSICKACLGEHHPILDGYGIHCR